MSRYLKTNDIISSAKIRAMIPENQVTYQEPDFIRYMNEEIDNAIFPSVLKVHEDYYLQSETTPIEAGKLNYPIPYRASGNRLRDVALQDSSGNLYELTRISYGQVPQYKYLTSYGQFRYFYIQNNEVILVSTTISTDFSLVWGYYIRPNSMVSETRAAQITAIDTTTGEVTVDQVPTNFSSIILYDFIQTKSPNKIISFDIPVVSVNTTTDIITFDPTNIPSSLSVGDYLMQAEETIIPNLPVELHSIVAHRVAIRCIESFTDTQALANALTKLKEMEDNVYNTIDNRVEESPQKIVNRNSALRNALYSKRYRRRVI